VSDRLKSIVKRRISGDGKRVNCTKTG